jgi:hypothetical protein
VIWTIEFDGGTQDVTLTAAGVASRMDYCASYAELVRDPRWRPGMAVLVDESALDVSTLTGRDVEEIAGFIVDLDDRLGPAALAVVAPDAYAEGLVGVLIRYLYRARLRACTFPSHGCAMEWLSDFRAGRVP